MKSYHNIETRKFPGKGYYVGYASGSIWHIYRGSVSWVAFKQENTLTSKSIKAKTLAEMSKKLEQL